ncbi:MAG: hypothetical protein K0S14_35 [Thermomicrobiales bacterium]|nr:hypothetical protein [Thermomicrobiales bacterium]
MTVVPGSNGENTSLTVDSAAESVFGNLLSDDPEYSEERETPTQAEGDEPEAPQADPEGDPEQPEEPQAEQTDEPVAEEPQPEEPTETPAYDPTAKFKVKVDGKEEEVTLEELAKGYSRTADYTRKTQEVAQHRKALEAETVAARQERAQLAQNLKLIEQAVAEITPQEPNWEKLRTEHPNEFPKVWAEWQQGEKDRAELSRQRAEAERKVAEDQFAARQERIKVEQEKLVTAIPAWKDEKVMASDKKMIQEYAESLGYTLEDLKGIDDHRPLVLMREAALYRRSQAKKPTLIKQIESVRTTKPGNATMTRTPPTALQRSLDRLAKTGSREDAQSVFLNALED